MEIGYKLKKARHEKGITQEQAAEFLGVSRQTISNWENNKSYPDIISVIKMSDLYAISLDLLLKEENSVKPTYQEFLEESTNTVKAKKNLGKIILLATYFLSWATAMVVFWLAKGPETAVLDIVFRWLLLPLLLLASAINVAKNDYWGKGNWFCVPVAAVTFLTIPCTKFIEQAGSAMFSFQFPNPLYMLSGIVVSALGLVIGAFWRKKTSSK